MLAYGRMSVRVNSILFQGSQWAGVNSAAVSRFNNEVWRNQKAPMKRFPPTILGRGTLKIVLHHPGTKCVSRITVQKQNTQVRLPAVGSARVVPCFPTRRSD